MAPAGRADDQAEGPELAAALASLRTSCLLFGRRPTRGDDRLRQRQAVLEEWSQVQPASAGTRCLSAMPRGTPP